MDNQCPKLAWPPRIVAGRFATVEQDSAADIDQCIETVCRYQPGDRDDLPDFGIGPFEFTEVTHINKDVVRDQVRRWEPRARLTTEVELGDDPFEVFIRVSQEGVNIV